MSQSVEAYTEPTVTLTPRGAAAFAVVATLVILQPGKIAAQQDRQAVVFVAVIDADGRPVKGLTAGDFAISENGEQKEVVSAGPATQPVALALLTDGLGVLPLYSAPLMRAALATVVRTVRGGTAPDSQIGLMRFDGAAIQQVKFSSNAAALDSAIARLASFPGSPVLHEAISDTCRTLRQMSTPRRMMFALVAGYRSDTSQDKVREVPECLRESGSSLWAIEAAFDEAPLGDRWRDYVLLSVTGFSGGLHAAVSTGTALEGAASRMADIIVSQYAVVYSPPGRLTDGRLGVFVKRKGVRVIAPAWTKR